MVFLVAVIFLVGLSTVVSAQDACVNNIVNAKDSVDCFNYNQNVGNEGSVPEVLCKCRISGKASAMVEANQACLFRAASLANNNGSPNLIRLANEFQNYLQGEAKRQYPSIVRRCSMGILFSPPQQIANCVVKRIVAACPKDRILRNP